MIADLHWQATNTVLRRQAAGLLLAGACRPWEVAWYGAYRQNFAVLFDGEPLTDKDRTRCAGQSVSPCQCFLRLLRCVSTLLASFVLLSWALLIGYEALLRCASYFLDSTIGCVVASQPAGPEGDDAQRARALAVTPLVVSAIDALAADKASPEAWSPAEINLVRHFRVYVLEQLDPAASGDAGAIGRQLLTAWRRLERTGELEKAAFTQLLEDVEGVLDANVEKQRALAESARLLAATDAAVARAEPRKVTRDSTYAR
jgi:hypothetical protein